MAQRRDVKAPEKVDIQMTPMIDIVFQLMAFFLMTFKVAAVEGDFNMKLPKDERSAGPANTQSEMINVVLKAKADGDLAYVQMGNAPPIPASGVPFYRLTEAIKTVVNKARLAGQEEPEIQLDADDTLRYENIIKAVAAVSSTYEGDTVVPLAKKVKFKPRAE